MDETLNEIIKEILEQREKNPDYVFDYGWNEGLSCAVGIIEHYLDSSTHENGGTL